MKDTIAVLDVHGIIWAAVHAIGSKLAHQGAPTYAHFGFLSQVIRLQEDLGNVTFCFCFDVGLPKRREIYEEYKRKRKSRILTPEEERVFGEVRKQIKQLRTKILPSIGFKNIFHAKGYEADDIIAQIVLAEREKRKCIIVSSDQDMYQLLGRNVSIWKVGLKAFFTKKHFKQKYGISPKRWAEVKAMAGCSTDEVAGIMGIGEMTAIKYLNNELKPESKKYESIVTPESQKIIKRNIKLVKLPYKGCPSFKVKRDRQLNWGPTMRKLGIRTLMPKDDMGFRGLR